MCAGKFLRASPPRRGIHPRGEGFTPAARGIPEESPDGRNLAPVNRWIELDGVVNMRDVGGLPTADGGRVQPQRLIRSDNLQDLSPGDVEYLVHTVGVSDVVDLRTNLELHLSGDGPLRAPLLRHHHHSFYPETLGEGARPADDPAQDSTARELEVLFSTTGAPEVPRADADYWSQHYRRYLALRPDSVVAALRVIVDAPGATIVHCAAGKDRTGTVIGLALAVAGVNRDVIVEDYVLTSERLEQIMRRLVDVDPYRWTLAGQQLSDQEPRAESMATLLQVVDDEFGGAAGWLRAQGWSAQDVDRLRAKLRAE